MTSASKMMIPVNMPISELSLKSDNNSTEKPITNTTVVITNAQPTLWNAYRIAASADEIAGEVVITGVALKWKLNKFYSNT